MLIPEVKILLAENAGSQVNNKEYNIKLEQKITRKGIGKRN